MTERVWRCGSHSIPYGRRTLVMGIVNVTPDSFSDGGRFLDPDAAVQQGLRLVEDGADILDAGGESTRPGSAEVPAQEELDRVIPVIEALALQTRVPVSVDTRKAEVAAAATEAGAVIVNDVSAGADPGMFGVVRAARAGLVLVHMQGDPKTMQQEPHYEDVVRDVRGFLSDRAEAALAAGIGADRLCVDPGIGFGKTVEHNLLLIRHLDRLLDLGYPLLVGPSRKRFLGTILGTDVDQRLEGTAGAVAWLAARGAHVIRVHDVKEMSRVVRVVDAIARAGDPS